MSKKIMIIAGEASGDMHGARLVAAMKSLHPEDSFHGMGGSELRGQGVEILFDPAKIAVVGIVEVIAHLKDIFSAQKILRHWMKSYHPDLLIIIDFPDFNLLLASKARKLGIPVFYYITPQVWAWRKGRLKTIKKVVDRLGVILPFEEQFFKRHGLQVDYVGHPLLDSVKVDMSKKDFCGQYEINKDNLLIGLLPGSRKKEISTLLPIFLEAAHHLQEKSSRKITFLIPLANTLQKADLEENGLARYQHLLDIQIIQENRYELMSSCDAAVAASGTVALELAILNVPMVIVYRVSPLTYILAKLLVKVEFASLVNLIAEEEIVPELLQEDANAARIESELSLLLFDNDVRKGMLEGLELVRKRLGNERASEKAAAVARELLSPIA